MCLCWCPNEKKCKCWKVIIKIKLEVRKIQRKGNRQSMQHVYWAGWLSQGPRHKLDAQAGHSCWMLDACPAPPAGAMPGRPVTAASGDSDTVNGRPATGSERNKPCQFWIPAFMAFLSLHREGRPGAPKRGCKHWRLSRLPVHPHTGLWEKGHRAQRKQINA